MYCKNIPATDLNAETGQEVSANSSSRGRKNRNDTIPPSTLFISFFPTAKLFSNNTINCVCKQQGKAALFLCCPSSPSCIVSEIRPGWPWAAPTGRAEPTALLLWAPVIVRAGQSWTQARWEWKELISYSSTDSIWTCTNNEDDKHLNGVVKVQSPKYNSG